MTILSLVLSISEDTHTFSRNLGIADAVLVALSMRLPMFTHDQPKSNRQLDAQKPQHVQGYAKYQRSGLASGGWQGSRQVFPAQVKNGSMEPVFSCFWSPQGFGLPIAEAMASAVSVGYSGGGGRELFRFGASQEVCFGDWPGFIAAVQDALNTFAMAPRETEMRLQRQAQAVRVLYGPEQERASIAVAWDRIATLFARRRLKG